MLGIVLYGVLGFVLSAAGEGVMEKRWQFFVILALVIAIDLSSKYGRI